MCTSISSEEQVQRSSFKTAEATGYSEHTVGKIVTEKSGISGTVFISPAKRYKVDI